MAREDEAKPELPRTLGGRYRPRWKDPPSGSPEDAKPSLVARDTIVDRELDLVRVPFGADRAKERDALVSELKARTTVLAPSLVAVHDAGEWEDDAFVALEQVEAGRSLEDALAASPSLTARLGWAKAIADAAVVLEDAGLSLSASDWSDLVVDAYDSPRVRGLDRAVTASDATRTETLRAVAAILERLVDGAGDASADAVEREAAHTVEAVATSARRGEITLAGLRDRLAPVVGPREPERPLLPNVDPASLQKRQAAVLIGGLLFFVLSFVVLIVVLTSLR